MNDAKLTRELKEIIYYIRKYGLDHTCAGTKEILADEALSARFYTQVHKGFYLAQERVLLLLPKIINEQKHLKIELTQANRQHNAEKTKLLKTALNKAAYQECVVRKTMDAIVWQLFNYEVSTLRRLFCGEEPIDITASNIQSEITYISQFQNDAPTGFALISDLTSFVQIGDVVVRIPNDSIRLVELKEGPVNERIFQLLNDANKIPCKQFLASSLQNESPSFVKHFKRTVKQISKDIATYNTINTGAGIDHASGLDVHIIEGDSSPETYAPIMKELSVECNKRGYSLATVQGCLFIGVYDTSKFPHDVFSFWAKSCGVKDPIYDVRQTFSNPLGYPIYLHPFSETFITDIVTGKKVIKIAIHTEELFKLLEDSGCRIHHLSKGKTSQLNAKSYAKNMLYELNGQGVEIEKDGASIYLGQGTFSKMFTNFFTPLTICQEILGTLDDLKQGQ